MSHHAHGAHAHDHRSASRRALLWVLLLTLAFTVVEVAGGIWTNSLALLADAGHMLSDNVAIALALVAVTLARRPSTPMRSFGLQRAEILAAFVNGLTLVLVSGWIVWQAVKRFGDRPEILGGWMFVVALLGLLVNSSAAWILIRSGRDVADLSITEKRTDHAAVLNAKYGVSVLDNATAAKSADVRGARAHHDGDLRNPQ